MPKVYTTGVFDILHRGHINILTQASALGDLYVGIMTDKGVEEAKGKRPILTLEERSEQLKSLPFVKGVVPYTGTRQIEKYEALRPDILVQGDDWINTADRTEELAYIKKHGVRLILLPRTEGISTTEIRKRIAYSARNDESFLLTHLRLVPIKDILLYEQFEEEKVARLVEKIRAEGVFFNPVSLVKEMVLIDGNNRLEALKRLGANFVPAVVYDYADIDLLANVHFKVGNRITRLSEFAREQGKRIEFKRRSPIDILNAAKEGKMIPNGETFHRVPQSVIRLPVPLESLKAGFIMREYVQRLIKENKIRFYQSSVYVCNEW